MEGYGRGIFAGDFNIADCISIDIEEAEEYEEKADEDGALSIKHRRSALFMVVRQLLAADLCF